MATLDLSLITQTLRNVLDANVRRLLGGIGPNQLEVTAMPPEQVDASTQTLNLHLYAVTVDPHYQNAVGMELADPPVSGQPLALRLYYILTSHLTIATGFDSETQQRIMGMAMKTLHDNPVITDTLQIAPSPIEGPLTIMDPLLQGSDNRIEISLRPMEPEDAVNFWAAEDQRTPRMSAFYEVHTILMEPEQPKSTPGIVYDVGLYVRSAAAAKVTGSRSELWFTMPQATGLGDQQIPVMPARTTLQPVAVTNKPQIRILGQNLGSGDTREITIRAFGWATTEVLNPDLNPDWELQFEREDEFSFLLQPVLNVDDGAGGIAVRALGPGVAEVGLRVISYRVSALERLETVFDAGRTSICLGVHITSVTGPDVDGRFQIDVSPVFALNTPGTEIALAIGGEIYASQTPLPPTPNDAGLFEVFAHQILFGPLFNAAEPGAHSIQLVVNGCESNPSWAEV